MFDKASRIIIIVLLTGILGMMVYNQVNTPVPSAECLAAIDQASTLLTSMSGEVGDTLNQYQTAAYDKAENINQQIFMANEYSLVNITLMAKYTEAMLEVQTACQ